MCSSDLIEQGILTPTTKQRLDELEARKEALNTSILEEELKKPVLTREWIRFWLEKFRKGDVGSTEHQRQIIDTFVNSVYVFDDRVVLNFNFTDDSKTVTREEVLGSSAVENAPPRSPDHSVWGFFCGGRYRTRTGRRIAPTSFPGLCCPKPRRALDILCRVVYTGSSKKTEEQGSAEWCRKTG